MDLSAKIKTLFKPPVRAHAAKAELSVKTGTCSTPKDFQWLETNIPCQKACPAGTNIPGYLTEIAAENFDKAYRLNLHDNVFPAVLGRVCSRPCEAACRHGHEGLGDPVAICFSKRSAADFSTQNPVLLEPWFSDSGKRVAVVGSGVAGLTAARNLRLLGHQVVVYEKYSQPGGMLNQGIPEFRLPREIIACEIKQITALGVDIICNTTIGDALPLTQLGAEFDAVVLAAGTLKPNWINLPGKELPGIRHGLDFLLEVNETGSAALGQRVIVIGGGFTAMDCARTAQRLGAEIATWDLKVLYRRAKENMRVTPGELDELEHEGIPLECHATPLAYLEHQGKLCGMRFRRTDTKEEFDVPADTILLATGQFPDTTGLDQVAEKIFPVGDFSLGASSLIEAIGHAKQAAEQIDQFLMGTQRTTPAVSVETVSSIDRNRKMDLFERQSMPSLPVTQRSLPNEVELGFDGTAAQKEAQRCYQCHYKFEINQDMCIKCDWCLRAKPRPECILMLKELHHDEDGRIVSWDVADSMREMNLIWINQDECIRCGACLTSCPVNAINLQKVSLSSERVILKT